MIVYVVVAPGYTVADPVELEPTEPNPEILTPVQFELFHDSTDDPPAVILDGLATKFEI